MRFAYGIVNYFDAIIFATGYKSTVLNWLEVRGGKKTLLLMIENMKYERGLKQFYETFDRMRRGSSMRKMGFQSKGHQIIGREKMGCTVQDLESKGCLGFQMMHRTSQGI